MKLNKEGLPEFENIEFGFRACMEGFVFEKANEVLHTWIKENCNVVESCRDHPGKACGTWSDFHYTENTHKAYLLPPIPIKECKHPDPKYHRGDDYYFCFDCDRKLKPNWEVV